MCWSPLGPVVIDVGAAGKGHLVDLVCEVLVEHGSTDHVVDASGDLRHAGTVPLRVGLEHPGHPDRVVGTTTLQGQALCASASNRRAWGPGLHHILDARTGVPVEEVLATWVVADDAATADGLATALFVAEPDDLRDFHFEWVRMSRRVPIASSPGWVGDIFS